MLGAGYKLLFLKKFVRVLGAAACRPAACRRTQFRRAVLLTLVFAAFATYKLGAGENAYVFIKRVCVLGAAACRPPAPSSAELYC